MAREDRFVHDLNLLRWNPTGLASSPKWFFPLTICISCLTSLGLSFFICEMGTPILQMVMAID